MPTLTIEKPNRQLYRVPINPTYGIVLNILGDGLFSIPETDVQPPWRVSVDWPATEGNRAPEPVLDLLVRLGNWRQTARELVAAHEGTPLALLEQGREEALTDCITELRHALGVPEEGKGG